MLNSGYIQTLFIYFTESLRTRTYAGDRRARNLYRLLVQETCKTKMADEQDAIESHFHSMLVIQSYEI